MIIKTIKDLLNPEVEVKKSPKKNIETFNSFNEALQQIRKENPIKEVKPKRNYINSNKIKKKRSRNYKPRKR